MSRRISDQSQSSIIIENGIFFFDARRSAALDEGEGKKGCRKKAGEERAAAKGCGRNMRCQFCGYETEETFCPVCGEYTGNTGEDDHQEYQEITREIESMNGEEFEDFCARLLENDNFQNVHLTKRSGDHGIDILAEKDEITYAFQCKCYRGNVGNKAVQEAHTGKILYHRDIAVVMTSSYFTEQAKAEARALGVKLWDRDKMIRKFF